MFFKRSASWQYRVMLFSALISGGVSAQDTSEAERPRSKKAIEEVVVTGTKRSERSASDLAVPVDVISRDDLRRQGSNDLLDILSSVVPSYNVGREPLNDAATLVRPANLRSLPTDSTLILFNSKRRHKSAIIAEFVTGVNRGAHGVDLFPLISLGLKQVEILRDGASAQYGSDAIAGVINFRLEDDPTIKRIQVQAGSSYAGDGDNYTISGIFGLPLLQQGFAIFTFEYGESGATSRGSQLPSVIRLNSLDDRPKHNIPNPAIIWGAPKIDDNQKLMFNVGLPIAESAFELYSFGTYSSRKVDGSFFYRNPYKRTNVFAIKKNGDSSQLLVADLTPGPIGQVNDGPNLSAGDGISCPTVSITDGVANAAGLQAIVNDVNCFSLYERFPDGFTPRFGGKVTDASIAGGFKGTFPKTLMTYDFSVTFGQNKVDYRIYNTLNASYGPSTRTDFNIGTQTQTDLVSNIDFTLPINIGAWSPLHLAFGMQYHNESYKVTPGQTESWQDGGFSNQGFSIGSNGFQGFSPEISGKNSRVNSSAYLEAEIDITSKWLLVGSLRYDNYSDFGSTTNSKFSTRYALTDSFNLRGSLSTGFRAPSVGQSNLTRETTTIGADGALSEQLAITPTNPIAVIKGGKALQPETSNNFALGAAFVLGPVHVTLDGYYIKVKDRLLQIEQDITPADRVLLATQGQAIADNITTVSFFINDFDSQSTGAELVATLPVDWGAAGYSHFTLAYSWANTAIKSQGQVLQETDTKIIENALPTHRGTLTWTHSQGRWTGLVRANYYSGIVEDLYGSGVIINTSDITVIDAELSWSLPTKHANYTVSVGLKNMLNQYLDQHRFVDTATHLGADYPLAHPAGFSGGSYYFRLSAEF